MLNPLVPVLTLISLADPARADDNLYRRSVAAILGQHSPFSDGHNQLVLMEIPGFPGKPVELASFVRIVRQQKARSLRITYWTIPATIRESEDLKPFLKSGIKTGFSHFPNTTFTIKNYPQYIDNCYLATSDQAGSQRPGFDLDTRMIGIKKANECVIECEGRYTRHESFEKLFTQVDSWLSPHKKRLHADVIRRLFPGFHK